LNICVPLSYHGQRYAGFHYEPAVVSGPVYNRGDHTSRHLDNKDDRQEITSIDSQTRA